MNTKVFAKLKGLIISGEIEKLPDKTYYVRNVEKYADTPFEAVKLYDSFKPVPKVSELFWQHLTSAERNKFRKEFNNSDLYDKYESVSQYAMEKSLQERKGENNPKKLPLYATIVDGKETFQCKIHYRRDKKVLMICKKRSFEMKFEDFMDEVKRFKQIKLR